MTKKQSIRFFWMSDRLLLEQRFFFTEFSKLLSVTLLTDSEA